MRGRCSPAYASVASVPQFRGEFAVIREGELEPADAGSLLVDHVGRLGECEPLLPLDVKCCPHPVGEVGAAVEVGQRSAVLG